jgi:hypothetical protein
MNEEYVTSDMTEIVYCFCRDVPLVRTSRLGQRVSFHFDPSARTMIPDINYGRDQVSLRKAMDSIRRARDLMHRTP